VNIKDTNINLNRGEPPKKNKVNVYHAILGVMRKRRVKVGNQVSLRGRLSGKNEDGKESQKKKRNPRVTGPRKAPINHHK